MPTLGNALEGPGMLQQEGDQQQPGIDQLRGQKNELLKLLKNQMKSKELIDMPKPNLRLPGLYGRVMRCGVLLSLHNLEALSTC